ncbi:MAG: integrase [Proteobacteria bacterium]|nr:integrase [Pseudomonadota bacterium]
MAMMIRELYDALKSAGAEEDKAREAASAVARFDDRFNRIEAELMLLKWMVTFNLAFTTAILWKIFS